MHCPDCGVPLKVVLNISAELTRYRCPKCDTHWESKVFRDGYRLIVEYDPEEVEED